MFRIKRSNTLSLEMQWTLDVEGTAGGGKVSNLKEDVIF